MKNLILVLVLLFGMTCHIDHSTSQYFVDSAEINMCKKALNAYVDQDWETYRSMHADTADMYCNLYFINAQGISVDKFIEDYKNNLANLDQYQVEEYLWEMIIDENGDKWVYLWGKWTGTLSQDEKTIETPLNIVYHIKDNVIVEEAGFWDNLPFYQAFQKEE